MVIKDSKYGRVTLGERLSAVWALLKAPPGLIYQLTFARWNSVNSKKSLGRIANDFKIRHLTTHLNTTQIQWLEGHNKDKFLAWGKDNKVNITAEDIGEDAHMLWVGEKRTDRVLLYLHGGGFVIPYSGYTAEVLRHIQLQLDVGVVMLDFSTVTERPFPAQLLQANTAIAYLLKSGVRPENLQFAGDSAGGSLILQIFSHILHDFPDPGFPSSPLHPILTGEMKPIRGAFLLSPWVNLSGHGGSFERNDAKDILPLSTYQRWGREVLGGIPREQLNFIEFHAAPADWFDGFSKLVSHVLITVAEDECLHDDVVVLNDVLRKYHGDVEFIDQPGIHIEPLFGFTGQDGKGEITKTLIDWYKRSFGP